MCFNEIYEQFIKSTTYNFPIINCTKQNKRESDVFDSDISYLCLVIDKRFNNYWQLIILYPYICRESENVTTFGWIDRNGNVYGNIENSTRLSDEFVIGFQRYCDNDYDKLWNDFTQKIEEQYDD